MPIGQAVKGALSERRDSKGQWRVKGTAMVFGKFRKFGFSFKRVVPVKVDFYIPNPIRDLLSFLSFDGDLSGYPSIVEEQRNIGPDCVSFARL